VRLLVISRDRLDGPVGGTSIRALELARVLAAHADVTLAGIGAVPAERDGIPCIAYRPQQPRALRGPIAGSDAILALPQWPALMRLLRGASARVAFDLYVPEALETIGGFPGQSELLRRTFTELAVDRAIDALHCGDFFVCASEKQRDLYLGMLLAERLIDPREDPALRALIDVVPFGVPEAPARATATPPFDADDEVVLWNGGIWPWLDPETAIRAVAALAARRPRLRLVFMGNATQVPAQRATEAARAVAAELGVLDRHVVFNDGWVPYEERADWLLAANCALYAHHDNLETRFAFRTRLLDCFWARLPAVCSSGDDLAGEIERAGAGAVFAPGDVAGCAAALESVLDRGRDAFATPLAQLAEEHRWSRVAQPLVDFLARGEKRRRQRRALRPAHALRRGGYVAARKALDLAGLKDYPRL
jgi:glycosyltransferase involved in cell wall biosynthesis